MHVRMLTFCNSTHTLAVNKQIWYIGKKVCKNTFNNTYESCDFVEKDQIWGMLQNLIDLPCKVDFMV